MSSQSPRQEHVPVRLLAFTSFFTTNAVLVIIFVAITYPYMYGIYKERLSIRTYYVLLESEPGSD